ncbi:MAG TPA: response regulator [Chloroflexota bacterium]|nr:response regulator [Chloroflexota bacterium]
MSCHRYVSDTIWHLEEPPRLLLVEDDESLRGYLVECLELAGHQVDGCRNGLEGLELFDGRHPDLVILDLDMPVMSGFRLLGLLRRSERARRGRIPVIVITGQDIEEAMDVVSIGAPEAYLKKPFSSDKLLKTVERLLARRGGEARWDHP